MLESGGACPPAPALTMALPTHTLTSAPPLYSSTNWHMFNPTISSSDSLQGLHFSIPPFEESIIRLSSMHPPRAPSAAAPIDPRKMLRNPQRRCEYLQSPMSKRVRRSEIGIQNVQSTPCPAIPHLADWLCQALAIPIAIEILPARSSSRVARLSTHPSHMFLSMPALACN